MAETARTLPVVVGVDGSRGAVQAVRWAAGEAAHRAAPLLLVHVWPVLPAVTRSGISEGYQDVLVRQGERWLAEAEVAAREVAAEVVVRAELSSGWAAERLIGLSGSAALVVLGSWGLGGFTGLVVGSVAVEVATHGLCPVVVVRGAGRGEPRGEGPVVVGVDGSPTSRQAVGFAFHAAAVRGVPLVAVHVWMDARIPAVWEPGFDVEWELIREREMEVLGQWLAGCRARYPDVRVDRVVARDRPARTLLEHAGSSQLVVVGSRGRGGFRGLLLGSTSQALIYHAACPVAVVPPRP